MPRNRSPLASAGPKLILALDIGTSSVRGALHDHTGSVLEHTMVKHERSLSATDDGGAEIDAVAAFEQVIGVVDAVLAKAAKVKGEITHTATSCFWHSLVGIDDRGKPATKVFGWADTRSRGKVELLRQRLDEASVHNRTGARFHSSYWPAKLLWLKGGNTSASEFAPYAPAKVWLSLSDYILGNLTDELFTSVSMASGTGIFDIRKCAWDEDLIKFLKLKHDNLPPVAADDATFRLNAKFAKRWPRLRDTKWYPAIGDGAANNIGAGCVAKSKAALMIGTSGAMRVAYRGEPPRQIPDGLWCYRIDRSRVILGGALSDGGGLYHWLKDNLRLLANDDRTEAEIASRPSAAHGLVFLPFLAGERSTGYHQNATGAILGLRTSTDAVDIVQAALESVAYRFAEIFDQLNSVGRIREIIASGGALRESPVWTQIIADVLGRDLTLPDTREASSRGAVLLALEKIAAIADLGSFPAPISRTFVPNRGNAAAHRLARSRQSEIYTNLMS